MGVLYEKFDNGEPLRTVTPKLREIILENYYWKHHNRLNDAVKKHLDETGTCLILDCHSFPSTPLTRALFQNPDTPDFNIGTDSFHTPSEYIEASKDFFESKGYSLGGRYTLHWLNCSYGTLSKRSKSSLDYVRS